MIALSYISRLASCVILSLLLTSIGVCAEAREAYTLDAMDVLKVRVSEWQTSSGVLRDWSSISGEYTVGADANISVPLVGQLRAGGRTTADIAEEIGMSLQRRFGLADRPDASVEVTTYRPVYVVGEVQSPGPHPFAPDLSVVKAVSLSGGLRRAADAGARVERDIVRSRGDLEVLSYEHRRLLLRQARLQAELAGRTVVEMPKPLQQEEGAESMLKDEQAIVTANARRVDLQRRSLNDLKTLLASEVEALGGKRINMERQIDLTREDLTNVNSLANKGLVVNTRVSDLERRLAEYESQLLDIDTSALRARQDINRAEQDLIKLENDRASELAVEKRATDAALEANSPALTAQRALLAEALVYAPVADAAGKPSQYSYTIQRIVGGKSVEIAATETTPVRPGDVVKVTYTPPTDVF